MALKIKKTLLYALYVFFIIMIFPHLSNAVVDYWPPDSWPQWRNDPAKNGFNPVSTLPGTTPVVLWKYLLGGQVNSSTAVVNGKVFVGSSNGGFYCLKQVTGNPNGELLWSYSTGGEVRGSPAVAYNRVFVTSLDGYLYCFKENPPNPPNGEVIWRYYIGPLSIMCSSPAVVNERVYVGSETGFLYCFDALTNNPDGELLWSYYLEGWIHSSPAIKDSFVYVANSGSLPPSGYRFFCFNALTGDSIWSFRIGDHVWGMLPTPAVANNRVYFSADDGWTRCLDASNGGVVWQRYITDWDGPSPAVAYGRMFKTYEAYGSIICWEAESSDSGRVIWEYDLGGADRTGSAVADGKVLAVSWSDSLFCFDALSDSASLLWTYSIPVTNSPGSAPSIANGMIFLGDQDGYLHALRESGSNLPPIAYAIATPDSGSAPLFVNFSGSGEDVDGTITSYFWSFGDGDTSSLQNPLHAYSSTGNYIASLQVTDNLGATNETTVFIKVSGVVGVIESPSSYPSLNTILVYPNPSTGSEIKFMNLPQEATLEIFTLDGRIYKRFRVEDLPLEGLFNLNDDRSEIPSRILFYIVKEKERIRDKGKLIIIR